MKALLICGMLQCLYAAENSKSVEITSIKITGEPEFAKIILEMTAHPKFNLESKSRSVELSLHGAKLTDTFENIVALKDPHPLVKRITAHRTREDVLLKVLLKNPLLDSQKGAVVETTSSGLTLWLNHPNPPINPPSVARAAQEPTTLASSENTNRSENTEADVVESQIKISKIKPETQNSEGIGIMGWIGLSVLIVLVVGGVLFFLSTRSRISEESFSSLENGSMNGKLIERVAFCSLGYRVGVCVLKINKDYLLVGTTPQSVNLIATLALDADVLKMPPSKTYATQDFQDSSSKQTA